MARYRCDACEAAFEADEPQCPGCLRRSSVRDADAPPVPRADAAASPDAGPRRGVPLAVASALLVVVVLVLAGALLALHDEAAYDAVGRRVSATILWRRALFGSRTGGCEVGYEYEVGGRRIEGRDTFRVGCPVRSYGSVEINYLPDEPARSRAVEGHGGDMLFTQAGSVMLVAFLVFMLPVWGNLAFPRSSRLRALAARIGSRHAQGPDRPG